MACVVQIVFHEIAASIDGGLIFLSFQQSVSMCVSRSRNVDGENSIAAVVKVQLNGKAHRPIRDKGDFYLDLPFCDSQIAAIWIANL